MTYKLLSGLRVVEGASFVAAPTCAQYFLQMGAEVIRFDPIGGGPDFTRWPRAPEGPSLYWEGLNKGKKSIALDLGRPEGRELAQRLAAAPGDNGGLFVTNYPVEGFLSHAKLAALRSDLISLRVMGWADGRPAVDYTVNSALGIPLMTGPASMGDAPVNHVLAAWDLLTGAYGAFALLAAERQRRETGAGQEIRLPLSDVALMSLGNLGQIAETVVNGDRPRMGNDLYGAFGRDFKVKDGLVMIVAISGRQWSGLVEALGISEAVTALEAELGVSFARDEGVRFTHRERLNPMVEAALATRTEAEIGPVFDKLGVCWGPYRTVSEGLKDPRVVAPDTHILTTVTHPSGYSYPTTGPAIDLKGVDRGIPGRAPKLGEHTDEVLANLLGLPSGEIGRLHDQGLVAGPKA